MKKLILVVIIAVISGCDSGGKIGVTASNDSASSNENGSLIERAKSLVSGKTSSATVKIPAGALINEALTSGLFSTDLTRKHAYIVPVSAGMKENLSSLWIANESIRKDALRSISPLIEKPENRGNDLTAVDLRFLDEITKEKTESLKKDLAVKWLALAAFYTARDPLGGWEVDPISDKELSIHYAKSLYMAGEFTNAIYTEIAAKLSSKTMQDPEKAKEEILRIYLEIPIEKIVSAWDLAVKNSNKTLTKDLAGAQGVAFTIGDNRVDVASKGVVIAKNGVSWFGDGMLSGNQYIFGLESSISSAMSKKSVESNTSTNADSSGKNSSVGVGK